MWRGKSMRWAAVVLTLAACLGPEAVLAQSAPSDGDTGELLYPRNTIRGGAVRARRPGLWIGSGIANFRERQQQSLDNYGGATPISEEQLPPSRIETLQVEVFSGLFDTLITLVEQLKLAIQASKIASQTSNTTVQ